MLSWLSFLLFTFLPFLRRLFHNDRKKAWEIESRTVKEAARAPGVDPRFEAEASRATAQDAPLIEMGRSVKRPDLPVRFPLDEFVGHEHGIVTGATNSGKTYLILLIINYILEQIAVAPAVLGLWVIEHKSELVPLTQKLIAGLLPRLPANFRAAFLDRLVVINPFSTEALVPFNLLKPDEGVPAELHAWEVASLINRVAGSEMGARQDAFLFHAVLLAIETDKTLPELATLMDDAVAFLAAAQVSPSERVRSFFRGGLKVTGTSLDGVRARLTRILRLPSMRLQLGAKDGLSFPELLKTKIVLIDLGSPPQGCEDIARFWAGLMSAKFARAVFARTHADAARPVLVVIDEWQEGLQGEGDVAGDYERLLAMARSRGVSMLLCSQSLAGASKVSTTLPKVVSTNTAFQWCFRASPEDARMLAHLLPITGREPCPRSDPWEEKPRSPFLSPSEERDLRIHEVSRMANRTVWYWNRHRSYPAVLMKTADVVLPAATIQNNEVAWKVRNGTLAKPIEVLKAAERAREGHIFRPLPPTTPTPPTAATPTPVAPRRPRPRRR